MIERHPRETHIYSSAASDIYERKRRERERERERGRERGSEREREGGERAVSYIHLRAHEPELDSVCCLVPEKKLLLTSLLLVSAFMLSFMLLFTF